MAGQKNMVTRVNQPEILGILWMVLTGLLFLGVTVLVKILGQKSGSHSRSVVGVNSLPKNSPVEIDGIFSLKN